MEKELLQRKLIRQLYKELGTPTKEDFPDEYEVAGGCWEKHRGYTTEIGIVRARIMETVNNSSTNWRIERPSPTKVALVEKYTRHGWYCTVQAYNVMCSKYVKHPRYEGIWVCFYSSRDCNKYEYIIERGEDE